MEPLDTTLAALSHTSRRTIVARLSSGGPARVTEIARPFDISLNAISKHLKVLEHAGSSDVRGRRDHVIAFAPEPLQAVARWIHPYERFWTERLDRLEAHFEQKNR